MHEAVRQGSIGRKVVALLAPHRLALAGLSALIVIAAALDLAIPFVTRTLIDQIVHILQPGHAISIQILIRSGAVIFGATIATRLLRSFYNYRLFLTVSKCEDEVKNAAFSNFLALDAEYHSSVNTGEVVGALDRGGTAIFVVLYELLGQNLLPPLLIVIGVLFSLVARNPWIFLIVLLPLPAYLLTIGNLSHRMHQTERQVSLAFETVTKESYDIASNVRAVKKFSREKHETATQRRLLDLAREKQYRAERLWALIENVQTFIATAGRVGVITLGGYLLLTRRCSVGDYFLFIALQDMVYGPISQLSIILPKLRRNLSRAERLFEILDEKPSICDVPNALALSGCRDSVEFRNVWFRYAGADRWAIRKISFTVPSGSMVALIGPSGSGKSTLMNLLQRLYDPQHGAILVDGKDLRTVRQRSLRDQIAVVPQEVELFSRTILENIAYGRDNVTRAEIETATQAAQAHPFIERCDRAYDTQVGERGLRLSGGERQRIGIARALVHDPEILILDEATSHLDNESERLIQLAFEKLMRGRTCFVIAHRLSTVRAADLVVVFSEGAIEAAGTHHELWDTSPTYRNLHELHFAEHAPLPGQAPEPQPQEAF
ncbi:MAG: ABC transporter ATP-binding protein [Acidobacteriaceae bacterium]|nr:ABC transporter ATP-binding protein [Acidobacteriaceae bacterium]